MIDSEVGWGLRDLALVPHYFELFFMSKPEYPLPPATIRPIGVYALSGLTVDGGELLAVDAIRGYLVAINPQTNNTKILNPHQVADWIGVNGLTRWEETFWFAKGSEVFSCEAPEKEIPPQCFTQLPYPVAGVAVSATKIYASCQKSGYTHILHQP
jgi:hypothetical protein